MRPYVAGTAGRCPRCGEGALFAGFLGIVARCPACASDLSRVDPGDGPAVFVILVAGALACFGLLVTDAALHPPIWLDAVVWLPAAAGLCLLLLRPFKGALVAAQIAHRVAGARRDG